jgi:putative endonuclease
VWTVYVLRSEKNGRLYTGSTSDLERRLEEHDRGKTRYTRYAGPFVLIRTESYKTRLEARQREYFLKSGRGRQELKELLSGH